MPVFRVEKNRNFTVMTNVHLRDKNLSLKAKGLQSLMLSLPPDWDFSLFGLAHICQDGIGSVRSGIAELENSGYLSRARVRGKDGRLGDIEYTIHEQPQSDVACDDNGEDKGDTDVNSANTPPVSNAPAPEKPICENPTQALPMCKKSTQLNTIPNQVQNKINTNLSILSADPSASAPRLKAAEIMERRNEQYISIKENIEFDYLCKRFPLHVSEINELFEIMLEAVCSGKETLKVNSTEVPQVAVKKRLLSLNSGHLEAVIEALDENCTKVRNIHAYLLTTLYNAPLHLENKVRQDVNYMMNGGK